MFLVTPKCVWLGPFQGLEVSASPTLGQVRNQIKFLRQSTDLKSREGKGGKKKSAFETQGLYAGTGKLLNYLFMELIF